MQQHCWLAAVRQVVVETQKLKLGIGSLLCSIDSELVGNSAAGYWAVFGRMKKQLHQFQTV